MPRFFSFDDADIAIKDQERILKDYTTLTGIPRGIIDSTLFSYRAQAYALLKAEGKLCSTQETRRVGLDYIDARIKEINTLLSSNCFFKDDIKLKEEKNALVKDKDLIIIENFIAKARLAAPEEEKAVPTPKIPR